ncbi:DUF4452 family conserved fungal protein [Schizosaccharomyces osmophilus]|uniref:DUF4452 family conserved fungal protein n=1 Tax=Schizosaccharomyces osmophilus TaxID=2545709 RepID=A0AAE9WC84_9SCHI|nr:DUF4452 family conserved fungal protein [Schizosaccharomyces osmophilus]WBW73702.1 DUF4452 family conserved fungal protein [Schizosaccharomyces osmophilus]
MTYFYKPYNFYQNSSSGYQLHEFRSSFEKARTFDAEDDLEFCPALSEEELAAIYQTTGLSPTNSSPSLSPMTPNMYPNAMPTIQNGNYAGMQYAPSSFQHNPSSRQKKSSSIPIIDPVTRAPAILTGSAANSRSKPYW